MMSTRSKKDGSDTPVSAEELAAMQKQIFEKERRLREEEREIEKRRLEFENKDSLIEQLRRELQESRASQPSTSRRDDDIPTRFSDAPEPRFRENEYREPEIISNFALREAIASIPNFDGQNSSATRFIQACKQARTMVPRHMEGPLAKLIRGKLRGRAYAAVEDSECHSIETLCDILRDTFGPCMDIDELKGDLAHIYMRKREHILDYISRVKELRNAIIDCDRDLVDTRDIDKLTARRFLKGLPNQIYTNMHRVEDQPLPVIFREAIKNFQRLELEESRLGPEPRRVQFAETRNAKPREPETDPTTYRRQDNSWRSPSVRAQSPAPYHPPPSSNFTRAPIPRYEPPRQRYETPRDNYTRTPRYENHRNDYARTPRHESPRNSWERDNTNHRPSSSERFCRYCKTPGHDIHECSKRQRTNMTNSGNGSNLPPMNGPRREEPVRRVQTITRSEEAQNIESRA